MDVPQPPPSRPLATIQRVWADFGQGIADQDDVLQVLNAVADLAQLEHGRLQEQAEQGLSDPNHPGFQQIVRGFEQHLEAVEAMALELEEPGQGHFDRGLELAREADRRLAGGHQQVVDQIEATSRVCCMFCRHENPRGSDRCRNCGRALPPMPGESRQSSFSALQAEGTAGASVAGPQGEHTANYDRLAAAIAAWRSQQFPADELLGAIEEVAGRLAAHQEANRAGLQEEEVAEACLRTDDLLNQSLAAIDRMKLAFEREDDSHLELGLDDFRQASAGLMQVYRLMEGGADPSPPSTPTAPEPEIGPLA